MNQKVAVIGAGRMGSALAAAVYKKGFDTTVWNRTSSKTEPLSRLGLRVAPSLQEAIGKVAGIAVEGVVTDPSGSSFTIYLTKAVDVSLPIAWFVIDLPAGAGPDRQPPELRPLPAMPKLRLLPPRARRKP